MSMHNIPLTDVEEAGLKAHGLDIGTPSQLSDAFRQGVAWGIRSTELVDYAKLLERQLDPRHPLMTILMGAVTRLEEVTEAVKLCNEAEGGSPLSPTLTSIIEAQNAFIRSLEDKKLAHPLLLKVDRSESNEDNPGMLVYNEDRTLNETITLDQSLMHWFGDDLIIYVKARLWQDGTLQLIARVDPQPW